MGGREEGEERGRQEKGRQQKERGEGERRGSTQGGSELREKHAFRKHESQQKTYNVNSTNLKVGGHMGFFILETHECLAFGFSLICIIVSTTVTLHVMYP